MVDRHYIKLKIGDIIRHEDLRSKVVFEILGDEDQEWKLKVIRILPYNETDEPTVKIKVGSIHYLTNGQMQFYKRITFNYNAVWDSINA